MKQGTTLFLLMFFVPWMLHAQEAPQTISLQQAVEFAIKHNKELQSSQMNIDLYRQRYGNPYHKDYHKSMVP